MAMNSYFQHIYILLVFVLSVFSATAIVNVDKCGLLNIVQPTILGRNVTFTFTPSWYETGAAALWQRTNKQNPWATLPESNKFTQFKEDKTFHLVLTKSALYHDEVYYRIQYYNDTVNCTMETQQIKLQDISGENCGFVYQKTKNIKFGKDVELEYYPNSRVIDNPNHYVRRWIRSTNISTENLSTDKTGEYEEIAKPNDKYVFTIFSYSSRKDGKYGVFCHSRGLYTNLVELVLPVAPSVPMFEHRKSIEDCINCIVGEVGVRFSVSCRIIGGTEPKTVTIAIGNESFSVLYDREHDSYRAFFYLRNSHHMATINCSVKNDALTSPLTVSESIYVLKPPSNESFEVPRVIKEGDFINITCTFASGRPAPRLSLNISNIELSPVHQINTFNKTDKLYKSVISFHKFNKTWYGQTIACCRHSDWYIEDKKCVTAESVEYLFPPSGVELELKEGENGLGDIYAVCTIYNSNPVCKAKWRAPAGSIYSERNSWNVSKPFGAWDSEYTVNVDTSQRYHDDKIICSPECSEFPLAIETSVNFPFAPSPEFNISNSFLEISKGYEVYVKCTARSSPKSNISWIEHSATGDLLKKLKQCDYEIECIIALQGDRISQRNLYCKAENFLGANSKKLTLNIIEKRAITKDLEEARGVVNSIYWVFILSAIAMIAIIVTISVVVRRKLKNKKANMTAMRSAAVDKSRHKQEDNCQRPFNPNMNSDVGEASARSGNICSEVNDESDEMSCKNVTYAVVNKTWRAHTLGNTSSQSQAKAGQLIYADLDFVSPDCNPIKRTVDDRRYSPTEYVGIDFVKTAEESARGEETDDTENVYANQ